MIGGKGRAAASGQRQGEDRGKLLPISHPLLHPFPCGRMQESARLRRLLARGPRALTAERAEAFRWRLNVLASFVPHVKPPDADGKKKGAGGNKGGGGGGKQDGGKNKGGGRGGKQQAPAGKRPAAAKKAAAAAKKAATGGGGGGAAAAAGAQRSKGISATIKRR